MTDWLSFDVVIHLWQSTLVIGVVWLMTLALRGNRARGSEVIRCCGSRRPR